MARVLNFSLTMKDGYKVERDIADLREHFDLETVLGLYKEGKLQRWLKRNGYAEEAAQLDDLDEDAPDFTRAFCRILGVEAADHDAVDVDEISERTWRRNRLRDYTADPYLLDMAENAAFSQEDLDTLIDEGAEEIVLCDGRFTIPLKARGTKYYGVGKAIAVIESDEIVDFERKYITFQKVQFDERYQSLCERNGTVVLRKRAEEAAAEARQREEEERRAREQRTVDQELQELRMKVKAEKAPEILAELLGVILHGSLFGGTKLWSWGHTADLSGITFRPWSRQKMKNFIETQGGKMPHENILEENEKIIGGIVLDPTKKKVNKKGKIGDILDSIDKVSKTIDKVTYTILPGMKLLDKAVEWGVDAVFGSENGCIAVLFTDRAICWNDIRIPYVMLYDVLAVMGENKEMVLRLQGAHEKDTIDLPLGQYVAVYAVQLFLLSAINFYGEHTRIFRSSEKNKLEKVCLVTLNDGCILNYLA